ncbi:MAG: Uma2 family endonuclease [Selenomonadaceae bacterium]|nr:Uma2 family endonuclease [Selenomonadaceae bacterium]
MEILNERLLYPSYEIIGGKKIMAPSAAPTHGGVIMRLGTIIENYLDANNLGYVFADDIDVHFLDGSLFKPDLSVILEKNSAIIDWRRGIYGAPDMVIEVLSKSTRRNDLTIKKDTYETNGVREYWIVDPWMKSIDVYLLRDGKYFFDDEYILFDADEIERLNDTEKATVKHEIPVKILDGLTIRLDYIFKWGYK